MARDSARLRSKFYHVAMVHDGAQYLGVWWVLLLM